MNSSRRGLADIARGWYSSVFLRTEDGEDERSHLLNTTTTFHTTWCEKFWIAILAVILVVGVAASTYLLILEGTEPEPNGFTLIFRKQWTSWPSCRNVSQLSLPAQRILLLPTNTSECRNERECLKTLRNLQEEYVEKFKETDLPHNFILTRKGRIYEGRGWSCSSNIQDNGIKVLTVALLGNYDDQPPTKKQVKVLEAFLEYSVIQNRISTCYQILARDSTTTYITDMAFELDQNRIKNIC